ncbi:hypothetical protein [Neoroseomonas rubea]|uniref:hypothetical protein n=1 Tax=Neoroseomonas rubea TaxID=2748666 RepID=UPI0018E01EED|nr:hypothetical protein [Roseomonas rubea]
MTNLFIVDRRAPQSSRMLDFIAIRGLRGMAAEQGEMILEIALRARSAAGDSPISTLTLVAHGAPGALQMGLGLNEHTAHDFSPLRSRMRGGPLSSVRCFACTAAANAGADKWNKDGTLESGWGTTGSRTSITTGRGYRLLMALARALGCEARGPVLTQYLSAEGYQRMLDGEAFRGPVLVVAPDGGFRIEHPDGSVRDGASYA